MNQVDDLTSGALSHLWHMDVISLECVDEEEGRRCYKASTGETTFFVKTQHDHGEFVDDLERGFRVQGYLEKNGFPTNRICLSKDSNLVERLNACGDSKGRG